MTVVLAATFASALVSTSGRITLVQAPYQIDTSVDLSPHEVGVDYGESRSAVGPIPRMTLLGEKGVAYADFVEYRQSCAHLCGEDREPTCHWVGVYRLKSTTRSKLAPLGALPDTVAVPRKRLRPAPAPKPKTGRPWLHEDYRENYRWHTDASDGATYLETKTMGRDFYAPSIRLASCTTQGVGVFDHVKCDSLQALYVGKRPLIMSFADYGMDRVKLYGSFIFDRAEYFVVGVGLKAEYAIGLLRRKGDTWDLLLRPREYPLLC